MGVVNIPITPHLIAALFFRREDINGVEAVIDDQGNIVLQVDHVQLPDIDRAVVQVSRRQALGGDTVTVIDGITAHGEGAPKVWIFDPLGGIRQGGIAPNESEADHG